MKGDFSNVLTEEHPDSELQLPAASTQTVQTMKDEFSKSGTSGTSDSKDELSQPRVRFSALPNNEAKHPNGLIKARYVTHNPAGENITQDSVKLSLPDVDSKLKVDHKHYEQWARVPNKRFTNTILFRGIQQLKARVKRDGFEDNGRPQLYSRQLQSRAVAMREVNTADAAVGQRNDYNRDSLPKLVSMKDINLVQKEQSNNNSNSNDDNGAFLTEINARVGTSKDKERSEAKISRVSLKFKYIENTDTQNSAVIRRQGMFPTPSAESGFSRSLSSIRHSTKQTETAKEVNAPEQTNLPKSDQDNYTRQEGFAVRDSVRPRYNTSKLRERSPFPVSIKQPKYYGEPAYLLPEPYKHAELPKSKTRIDLPTESCAKPEQIKEENTGLPPKFEMTEFKLPGDTLIQEEVYRAKSFITSFPSKKHHPNRTPAMVPSAHFCDISQLEDAKQHRHGQVEDVKHHRHSAYSNLLERTRTESACTCKNPQLLKWVPRVQRMKELLK